MATWTKGFCQKCRGRWRAVTTVPNTKNWVVKAGAYEYVPTLIPKDITLCRKCWDKIKPKTTKVSEPKPLVKRKIDIPGHDKIMKFEFCHMCGESSVVLSWDDGGHRQMCPDCLGAYYKDKKYDWKLNGLRVWWRDDHIPLPEPPKVHRRKVVPKKAVVVSEVRFTPVRKIEW